VVGLGVWFGIYFLNFQCFWVFVVIVDCNCVVRPVERFDVQSQIEDFSSLRMVFLITST
jgi:hypothetical protein